LIHFYKRGGQYGRFDHFPGPLCPEQAAEPERSPLLTAAPPAQKLPVETVLREGKEVLGSVSEAKTWGAAASP